LNREQVWLLPPSLDELVPEDHPARFVAAFVDSLDRSIWSDMEIKIEGEHMGAPSYHPRALLSVWLYGFMTGTRSSRKLEAACRDQLPYLWLTGWQQPDHNTLWRFYQEHRKSMKLLFKQTVRTAIKIGLVDLAIQAVDGTKVAGNASKDRVHDAKGLKQLLERTETAIANLEAQNEQGNDPPPPHLPEQLAHKQKLKEEVKTAMEQLAAESGRKNINLTDGDTQLMRSRQGIVPGYNLQAVVAPVKTLQGTGHMIVAAEVVQDQNDMAQLEPMLKRTEEITGERPDVFVADAGYCSGSNLQACAEIGQVIVMPASQQSKKQPFHKDNFTYAVNTDSYTCPHGQNLCFAGIKHRRNKRLYRASKAICGKCSAFGVCTRDKRQGRALEIGPYEALLKQHHEWMQTDRAKLIMRRRKELPEPVFGILKEQQSARRFLLRGLSKVNAEAQLLVTAFNLRTLYQNWRTCLIKAKSIGMGEIVGQHLTSGMNPYCFAL
jgi:transposase